MAIEIGDVELSVFSLQSWPWMHFMHDQKGNDYLQHSHVASGFNLLCFCSIFLNLVS